MKTSNEILRQVGAILKSNWTRRAGRVVPTANSVELLNNSAVEIEGAVLYADLAGSSKLTQEFKDYFVAEIYKSFLFATSEVIKNNAGEITAFDGDRVMAVFVGDSKCSNAAKAALQILAIVRQINDLIASKYPTSNYRINYGVGMDCSNLFVVKTGIRNDNDLAWIGDASNVAAKLSNIRSLSGHSFMTKRMFNRLSENVKYSFSNGVKTCMWNETSEIILGHNVYQSTWYWGF